MRYLLIFIGAFFLLFMEGFSQSLAGFSFIVVVFIVMYSHMEVHDLLILFAPPSILIDVYYGNIIGTLFAFIITSLLLYRLITTVIPKNNLAIHTLQIMLALFCGHILFSTLINRLDNGLLGYISWDWILTILLAITIEAVLLMTFTALFDRMNSGGTFNVPTYR